MCLSLCSVNRPLFSPLLSLAWLGLGSYGRLEYLLLLVAHAGRHLSTSFSPRQSLAILSKEFGIQFHTIPSPY
jgi:hypothetical protein